VPLDLTPLVSGTESLTPVVPDARTMVPQSGGTEALTPETGFHPTAAIFTPGTLPGPNTFPDDILCVGGTVLVGQHVCGEGDADTLPGDNFIIPATGLALDAVSGDTQTLTPLTED
jgi:hypothetical protein